MASGGLCDGVERDAAIAALAASTAAAMLVDDHGAIVWANAAARRTLAEGFDAAAQRALARIAAAGSEGLVRLRISEDGRSEAHTFRSSRFRRDGFRGALLEALTPSVEPQATPDLPASPPAEADEVSAAPRDDFAEAVEAAPAGFDPNDAPPDPRTDLAPVLASPEPEPASPEPEPALPEPAAQPVDLRFAFEIGADRTVSFLSPDLAEAVGASARSVVGRPWAEVSDELGLDPSGAASHVFDRQQPVRDLLVSWPMQGGGRLPIALSALPIFDRGRTFIGFRGLGYAVAPAPADLADDLIAAPDALEAEPEPATPVAAEIVDPVVELAPAEESPEVVAQDETSLEAEAFDRPLLDEPPAIFIAPPPQQQEFHGNVVPLRDVAATRSAPPPPLAVPPLVALSRNEESAFDEIARRLRSLGVSTSMTPAAPEAEAEPSPIPAPPGEIVPAADPSSSPQFEEALRLLDRLPVGVLVLRMGELAHANRAALDMTGHTDLAKLVERGADDLFGERLPGGDDAAPAPVRLIASDGVEVEVEARLATIVWGGTPATLVVLKRIEGITATAQAALNREREIAEILDTATDGVLTLDATGRILSVNRSAEALFGFEGREAVGTLFTLSLAPESRRIAFDYLDGLKSNGVAAALNDGREVLGLARHGGAIPLYMTIGRIGAPAEGRFCAVLRDITHWKKAEEEILAAKRQAERVNAQKSEFLARVSREIRTPLNAIIGFSEVMMEERLGPLGNVRYKEYLRDIHVSGEHLVTLVDDLLDLSRVESGRQKLEFVSVDLNEIVAQAAALHQQQANREHVIIRTSLARRMPPVIADRRSVRQMLSNLIANAVKSSRPGGQVIVATSLTETGQAAIRVRDASAGLSKKELERALEPFRPLASGEATSGLGLPLTKALAEANQAVFSLQSAIGAGVLAEIAFPSSRVLAG